MDAEKRRPERQLYRPPPSRMTSGTGTSVSLATSMISTSTTNANSSASSQPRNHSHSNLTGGEKAVKNASSLAVTAAAATTTSIVNTSSVEPQRTMTYTTVVAPASSSIKSSPVVSTTSSVARSRQTVNNSAAEMISNANKASLTATAVSSITSSNTSTTTTSAHNSGIPKSPNTTKKCTTSTTTKIAETDHKAKREVSKIADSFSAISFSNWNDIMDRSQEEHDNSFSNHLQEASTTSKTLKNEIKPAHDSSSSSTFKCDSGNSSSGSKGSQQSQTFYGRPGRSFRNRNLPTASNYKGGNTTTNHNNSTDNSAASTTFSATFPIGHFVIDEAVQAAVSQMHQRQQQQQLQQSSITTFSSSNPTANFNHRKNAPSSPAINIGGNVSGGQKHHHQNQQTYPHQYHQQIPPSSSRHFQSVGSKTSAAAATHSYSSSENSYTSSTRSFSSGHHYHDLSQQQSHHQQQHSQSSQGSQHHSHHHHPQQFYNSSYFGGGSGQKQQQQLLQQTIFSNPGVSTSSSYRGSSGQPRETIPKSIHLPLPNSTNVNHHHHQQTYQQQQQQFNSNYHQHGPQPHQHNEYQKNPPQANVYNSGSKHGSYTVFRSKWQSGDTVSTTSLPYQQQQPQQQQSYNGATTLEFYRKKPYLSESGHHYHSSQSQNPNQFYQQQPQSYTHSAVQQALSSSSGTTFKRQKQTIPKSNNRKQSETGSLETPNSASIVQSSLLPRSSKSATLSSGDNEQTNAVKTGGLVVTATFSSCSSTSNPSATLVSKNGASLSGEQSQEHTVVHQRTVTVQQHPQQQQPFSSRSTAIESTSSMGDRQHQQKHHSANRASANFEPSKENYNPQQRQRNDDSLRSNSSSSRTQSNSTSSLPKGGLLRLNTESMKLLKSDAEKSASVSVETIGGSGNRNHQNNNSTCRSLGSNSGSSSRPSQTSFSLDPSYGRELSQKLAYVISNSKQQKNHRRTDNSQFIPALSIEHNDLFVEPLRYKLMAFYEEVLLSDLKSPLAANALQDIWNSCFYPFVDNYRNAVQYYQGFDKNDSGSGGGNQVVAAAVAIAQRTIFPATNSTADSNNNTSQPESTSQSQTSSSSGIITLNNSNNIKASRHLNQLTSLVNEGIHFFESLVTKFCSTYDYCSLQALIDRRKHYGLNRSLFSALQELTYYMKILYIYMGDLTRYYQCVQPRPNFEQSKNYYLKAHILVPKNSHACSQLAMIAYYQKRYFEALYYFIRSFESETNLPTSSEETSSASSSENSSPTKNSIKSSITSYSKRPSSAASSSSPLPTSAIPSSSRHYHKQMLTVIFDDIRLAYDKQLTLLVADYKETLAKSKPISNQGHHHQSKNNADYHQKRRNSRKDYRIEYWIAANSGAISVCDMYDFYDLAAATSAESDPELLDFYQTQLKSFEVDCLKRRFISTFLMVHGMLNCRSGNLDRFFDVAKQMLLEFEQLLHNSCNDSSSGLSSLLLVQLIVINIYTISNTITEEDRSKNAAQYSFTHMNAYFIMAAMVEAVLRRLIVLFDGFKAKHAHFMEEFRVYQQAKSDKKDSTADKRKSSNFDQDGEKSSNTTTKILSLDDLFGRPEVVEGENEYERVNEEDWREFYRLLPVVKIWSDWVISTKPRFPPAEMNDIGLRPHNNETIWHVFGRFLTLLNQFKTLPVDFYCEEEEASVNPLAFSPPKCTGNAKNEYELVQLPEDRVLEGFRMILNAPESSKYIRLPYVPESAYTYMRIASIQLFGDYLCGIDPPYLWYNCSRRTFESKIEVDDVEGFPGLKFSTVQEKAFLASLADFKRRLADLGIESDEEEEKSDKPLSDDWNKKNEKKEKTKLKIKLSCSSGGQLDENDNEEAGEKKDIDHEEEEEDDEFREEWEAIEEMNQLGVCSVERRKLLQYRQLVKNCPQSARYFKLMEHFNDKKRHFVIKPRYVLLDTNCLIGNLEAIKRLVLSAPFTVLIPLIVIHELEFMASRAQRLASEKQSNKVVFDCSPEEEKKAERFATLGRKATIILEYLKEVFIELKQQFRPPSALGEGSGTKDQQQPLNIRAVTSKGTLLDTIDFKEDRNDPNALNNDDLVLYSASRLIESLPPSGQTPESLATMLQQAGEKVSAKDEFIYREVVLITDDLELRLKALCFEVPVKKLRQFLKWTKAFTNTAKNNQSKD